MVEDFERTSGKVDWWTKCLKMTSMSNLSRRSMSAIPSTASQRSIDEMMPRERSNSFKDLQAMLIQMQENMTKNHDVIKKEMGEIRNDTGELKERMLSMDLKYEQFQQQILKNEQKLKDIEDRIELDHKKMEEMNEKLSLANKELGNTVLLLEAEKANHYLRIQNLVEVKGEDLPDIIADVMAKALGIGKEEMFAEFDEIFRINTNYARRHNLPKEIHVKLVKKSIRDEILHRVRDEPIEYRGRQLVVLKQVPKRIRDLRKPYLFLTSKLIRHNVNFRWLVPEGLSIVWQDKRVKIDSIDKAEEFYQKNFEEDGELAERGMGGTEEIRPTEIQSRDISHKDYQMEATRTLEKGHKDDDKLYESREVRSTRATRPKYK